MAIARVHHQPVSVLKCKMGELEALRETDSQTVGHVTPLVELLANTRDQPESRILPTFLKCAMKLALDGNPLWVDPYWLPKNNPLRTRPQGVFGELDRRIDEELGVMARMKAVPNLIPVLHTSMTQSELATVRFLQEREKRQIAVRVRKPRETDTFHIIRRLHRIAERSGVTTDDVHLILDEQYVDHVDEHLVTHLTAVAQQVRDMLPLASVTLLSGDIPDHPGTDYRMRLRARVDRQLWRTVDAFLREKAGAGIRYGDYGVVPPIPKYSGSSGQVHPYLYYTTQDHMLFAAKQVPFGRDGKISNHARAGAFTQLADMLTEHPCFLGAEYSWGDREFVRCCSSGPRRAGTPAEWLAMATSHHLTHMARNNQLGPGPQTTTL